MIPQSCCTACPYAATLTVKLVTKAVMEGGEDKPQRARQSAEVKIWKCIALVELDEPLKGDW